MDPQHDPFQPRTNTPPPSPQDQIGQYAPMINPGTPPPQPNPVEPSSYSDPQAVDWARSKIASLQQHPQQSSGPYSEPVAQPTGQPPANPPPPSYPEPATLTAPPQVPQQPLMPPVPVPPPKATGPAFMPKQQFGTYDLPEEEAEPQPVEPVVSQEPVPAPPAPQPEPLPPAEPVPEPETPTEITNNHYQPLQNVGEPPAVTVPEPAVAPVVVAPPPAPEPAALAPTVQPDAAAVPPATTVSAPAPAPEPTNAADVPKPQPDNQSWLSKIKQFYGGRPKLPSKFKPFVTAALVGVGIFFLFNSQVLIGQIQYFTNSGTEAAGDVNSGEAVSAEPVIIIPKINVNVPVVYDINTYDEAAIQKGLERGVVHYANTAVPGQVGNNVIVGHSSNNWWASGKYKFAFVLLNKLEVGDTFVLHYKSKKYVYKVSSKKIVEPNDLSVVQATTEPVTTLITCDPPGTALRRLAVTAKQISPSPTSASEAGGSGPTSEQINRSLPSNSPSFWEQLRGLFD